MARQKDNPLRRSLTLIITGLVISCLLGPLSLDMGTVPVSMQTLALFFVAGTFGKRIGTTVAILYVFLGASGLPVFAGFSSGYEKLTGPTAGFLWAFPFVCYFLGFISSKYPLTHRHYILHFILAHILLLIIGFAVLMITTKKYSVLNESVPPLIPGLILKSIIGGSLALIATKKLSPKLVEAGK